MKLDMLKHMTHRLLLLAAIATGLLSGVASAAGRVFELRIYTANEGNSRLWKPASATTPRPSLRSTTCR